MQTKSIKKALPPQIQQKKEIPESFLMAAGMLKGHTKTLRAHAKKVRAEWDTRKF